MGTALFCAITHRVVVISYRRFGTTYRPHLPVVKNPKRWSLKDGTDRLFIIGNSPEERSFWGRIQFQEHVDLCRGYKETPIFFRWYINPLTPNDHYSGRTAPLTSKRCILYIYSTNIGTEYFKHGIYSSFFCLQNAVCFIILTYLVPVLFTFSIQGVLKLKKKIPAPNG